MGRPVCNHISNCELNFNRGAASSLKITYSSCDTFICLQKFSSLAPANKCNGGRVEVGEEEVLGVVDGTLYFALSIDDLELTSDSSCSSSYCCCFSCSCIKKCHRGNSLLYKLCESANIM